MDKVMTETKVSKRIIDKVKLIKREGGSARSGYTTKQDVDIQLGQGGRISETGGQDQ